MAIMATKVCVDRSGRIVLPKPVRDRLRLEPGDDLVIEADENAITLRPIRPKANFVKKRGIWVYQGEPSDESVVDLIERVRDERIKEIIG
jgi:AbrB family looped-hinge helix DNA binding protein